MTTKEYLSQISRLNRVMENKFEEIKQLRELSQSVKSIDNTRERVDTTPNFDKIGTAVSKIDELERDLDTMIDEYVNKKNKIIMQIDSMKTRHYIQFCFQDMLRRRPLKK